MYRNLPIKCPWALEIHGPKNGGGRLHGEAICTYNAYTHGIIKKRVGAYTEMGAYSGEYGIAVVHANFMWCGVLVA